MYQNILNHEFKRIMKEPGAVIIDVRTPQEIQEGYIPGASIFVDFNNESFEDKAKTMDKSKTYLIYCRSGARSAKACRILEELGFKGPLYNLAKGISEWDGEIKNK
ncbi:rhodanese-like domain-containing protein [Fulvivirga sedimenti]|uniref:Rhodanese-like domain-containing protein n=1 Tax=Fulvivirga sedimenti TaxID=2879465 RepID=A0A9X1HSD2_9BACT|nr:rhodanese-like domain-containing protein [Fulvivirga sedimenti]MCA6074911.1 rhodanese-like domain-containing protein [Fulvivirga sedimenti]MCA6076088.1 rhodanese-like domain-containing protein [Fulvivirga sedimenti]MCA6077216.1 rhodanese-like domain-containing protein [Fulvivirga sedimenti]